ncbi:MAG: hypothetical protein IJP17_05240 [Clostridia bacterium]|nr:hypothetical protein [Clostridia bacterium]
MYKVFAEFESVDYADRAAGQLRDRIPEIGRITRRRIDWTRQAGVTDNLRGGFSAAADWMFTPNTLYQGGTWMTMASGGAQSATEREREFEPAVRHEYILCAEGSPDAVDRAAHMLRALGGINVNVTSAPGRFF